MKTYISERSFNGLRKVQSMIYDIDRLLDLLQSHIKPPVAAFPRTPSLPVDVQLFYIFEKFMADADVLSHL